MRALMWFRSDLRVHDNTALSRACAESDEGVVAVFCVCPRQWKDAHDWGDVKAGFVMRNLRALADRLGTLRIPLKIVEVDDFKGVADAFVGVADPCEFLAVGQMIRACRRAGRAAQCR